MNGFKINKNVNEVNSEDLLTITAEKVIVGGGKPDFIISKEIDSDHGKKQKSIIMMIEFGVGNKFWWQKHDQILLYVEELLRNRKEASSNETFIFDHPILLTIVTVNKQTDAAQPMHVRFGMFLCTRKNLKVMIIALRCYGERKQELRAKRHQQNLQRYFTLPKCAHS